MSPLIEGGAEPGCCGGTGMANNEDRRRWIVWGAIVFLLLAGEGVQRMVVEILLLDEL